MNLSAAGNFILSAFGMKNIEDPEDYCDALTGAILITEGLFELTKIRKILTEALKK